MTMHFVKSGGEAAQPGIYLEARPIDGRRAWALALCPTQKGGSGIHIA